MKRERQVDSLREVLELSHDIAERLQVALVAPDELGDRDIAECARFVRARLVRAKACMTCVGVSDSSVRTS